MANGEREKNLPSLSMESTELQVILKYEVLLLKHFPAASFQHFFMLASLYKSELLRGECRPNIYSNMTFYRQFFKNKTKWLYSQLMQIEKRFKLEMELKKKAHIEWHGYSHKESEFIGITPWKKNRSEEKMGGITEQPKGDEWQFITFVLIF